MGVIRNMSLTIETGAGIPSADSYITEVDAQALALDYGISLPVDITEAEIVLRQGYLNIDTNEPRLQGCRVYAIQTGAFPRSNVYANGFLVPSDEITQNVMLAQLYAASAISSGVDVNAVDNGQDLSGFNVQGAYSETYQDGSKVKVNSRITGVQNSLQPYYQSAISGSRSYREFEYLV
jgi:hypothetical protein